MVNRSIPAIFALAILAVSLLGCNDPAAKNAANAATAENAVEHAGKHLDPKFVCPMHPQIVRNDQGSCPICGMNLVAKRIDAQVGKRPAVTISGEVIQSMGVRTASVERGTLWKYIRTLGRVEYDETRRAHVHPRAEGWLEKLRLRSEGEEIRRGAVLGDLYAPAILSAQVDFLIALKQYGKANPARVDKARNLLRLLDVPEYVIKSIQDKGESRNTVPILAPISGVVTKLGVRDGMYVTPGTEMMTLADLKHIWVMVDVYENQIAWLSPGLQAQITVPAHPGRSWKGQVDYVYPDLDPQTRTLRVRLAFDNPDQVLKPNMFAEVVIYGGPKHDTLLIPRDALIETGERETVVTALGDGRFQPVDVVTGSKREGKVEILSGLEEGDRIVVSGQFLIDSESSLQASFLRMSETDQ